MPNSQGDRSVDGSPSSAFDQMSSAIRPGCVEKGRGFSSCVPRASGIMNTAVRPGEEASPPGCAAPLLTEVCPRTQAVYEVSGQ